LQTDISDAATAAAATHGAAYVHETSHMREYYIVGAIFVYIYINECIRACA